MYQTLSFTVGPCAECRLGGVTFAPLALDLVPCWRIDFWGEGGDRWVEGEGLEERIMQLSLAARFVIKFCRGSVLCNLF